MDEAEESRSGSRNVADWDAGEAGDLRWNIGVLGAVAVPDPEGDLSLPLGCAPAPLPLPQGNLSTSRSSKHGIVPRDFPLPEQESDCPHPGRAQDGHVAHAAVCPGSATKIGRAHV